MTQTLQTPKRTADHDRLDTLNSCDMLASIVQRLILDKPIGQDINADLLSLRSVADVRERLSEIDGMLSKRKQLIELALLSYHEQTGLESVKGGGMSVSFKEDVRIRPDPEKWEAIYEWAVATKNTQILYKQIAGAKAAELIEGGVEMPAGLSVESYVKINARRV